MISNIINTLTSEGDPRVQNWLFMNSINKPILISVLYLLFVTIIGPKFMKKRKPYDLQNVILVYNCSSIFINAYIAYQVFNINWFRDETNIFLKCNNVDYETPKGLMVARGMHLYFLSKFIELLDTIFFVLRKKQNQVTFLHVYHHFSVIICFWILVKYYPGGTFSAVVFMNCIVHVIMYLYYFIAALGPEVQKYLWWKNYLTILQLIQFIFGITHVISTLLNNYKCNIPISTLINFGFFVSTFFILFLKFYVQTYSEKSTIKLEDLKK